MIVYTFLSSISSWIKTKLLDLDHKLGMRTLDRKIQKEAKLSMYPLLEWSKFLDATWTISYWE